MKKILAPTDFSPSAQNALVYAAKLAKKTNSKLTLLHAYHSMPVTIDVPVIDKSLDDIYAEAMTSLGYIRENLINEFGEIEIDCDARLGFATDVINDYALDHYYDLIVMGMQGASFLNEMVIGSITTSLMQDAPCPILAVGKDMEYTDIEKVVWAGDSVKTPGLRMLADFKNFLDTVGQVHIDVIHIVHQQQDDKTRFAELVAPSIQNFLNGKDYAIKTIESEDIVQGINDFVEKEKADLVVMVPRKHNIWRNLFFEPNTKRMAFHSLVPVLIIKN